MCQSRKMILMAALYLAYHDCDLNPLSCALCMFCFSMMWIGTASCHSQSSHSTHSRSVHWQCM